MATLWDIITGGSKLPVGTQTNLYDHITNQDLIGGSCGLSTDSGPKPGDPELNNRVLSARATFGGVVVSWTYPDINSHAVAHTYLYRSTSSDVTAAPRIAIVSGDTYFDRIENETLTTYYYWIRMVSTNGTVGDLIGPVSALALPDADTVKDILQSRIDDSLFVAGLRDKIDSIQGLVSALDEETQARLFGSEIFTELLERHEDDINLLGAQVLSETNARIQGTQVIVDDFSLLLARFNEENAAFLLEQATYRADEDSALAASIELTQAEFGDSIGLIQNELGILATADGVTFSRIETIETEAAGTNAIIQENKDIINLIEGELDATYKLKIQTSAGGRKYVAGFGLNVNDTGSSFGVLADNFYILSESVSGELRKPFSVGTVNGTSTIVLDAPTLIGDGTITNAKIGDYIESDDYNQNDPLAGGWRIKKNGNAIFNSVYVRGDIEATSLTAGSAMVDTLNIGDNAVTVPTAVSTSGGTTISNNNSWYTVETAVGVYGSYPGGNVMVFASANLDAFAGGGETRYEARIVWSGASYGLVKQSAPSGFAMSLAVAVNVPGVGAGNQTFTLQVRRIVGGTVHTTGACSISLLSVKR